MRPLAAVHRSPTPVVLCALLLPLLGAKPSAAPVAQRVPSVEEVVEKEGFTPTASQSEIYRPGAVLVPNAKGGHDVIVDDCVEVPPRTSVMSQSSIATSLATGVSARLGVAKGSAAAGIEKRLSFVDPEQRTIPLAQLAATEACAKGVKNAARFVDLSRGIVIYDVLVAQITNSVCIKADASGKVVTLAAAEAAAYSECVQESDAQVPLGYKAVPLAQLVAVDGVSAPGGSGWSGSGSFGKASGLAKQLEAAEKRKAKLEAKLAACLKSKADKVRAQAESDWEDLAPLAAKTDAAAKAAGKGYFERFLSVYGAPKVSCKNELGERSQVVLVAEVAQARAWLGAPAVSVASASIGASGSRVVGGRVGATEIKDPVDLMRLATDHLRAGRNAAAETVLNRLLELHPRHEKAVEARYRLGEVAFNEKSYPQAVLRFQLVIDKHKKSIWAPWAMLRQGQAFDAQGQKDNAKLFYEAVERLWPDSPAAKEAGEMLKKRR